MSAKQLSLKSPVTIAVVMVLLVAVVAFNVRTFGNLGRNGNAGVTGARLQAHPPVPQDLRRAAVHEVTLASVAAAGPAHELETLQRDPFFLPEKQPKKVVPVATRRNSKPKAPKPEPLVCSAIMLGGTRPMAIINELAHNPGDLIRGMELVSIDAEGVTLQKENGIITRLLVGVQDSDADQYRVVSRTPAKDDQGRTSLANNPKERTPK